MFDFLVNTPAWHLIVQSDIMTKIIIFCLFVLSIFCLWVVICKFLIISKERKFMMELNKRVKSARSIEEIIDLSKQFKETAGGRFLAEALVELKSYTNLEAFQLSLEQIVEQVSAQEEQYLPLLGISAAVSPLIGLFGTIWGLIHSFVDISSQKSADISVVAPGIAEALITTLAGLVVAIPALIFFHYFSNELRRLEAQLYVISDKFLNIVKQAIAK